MQYKKATGVDYIIARATCNFDYLAFCPQKKSKTIKVLRYM